MYAYPDDNEDNFDKYDEPRLHMERLLKAKLVEFDLSLRILLPLESAGIITLGDLVGQSRKSLRGIKNLGRISIDKLEHLLSQLDLSLSK